MSSEIWALLIGIDEYDKPGKGVLGSYPNLRGAVRDVRAVETHLRDRVGLPASQIVTMTSPGEGASRPTYANIIAALRRMLDTPNLGELYLHYSGHGVQLSTRYPTLKDTWDEALAPADFANGRGLLDIELLWVLSQFSERGVRTTVVLDSCHSGGMTRGDAQPRGLPQKKPAPVPPSLLASDEELIKVWRKITSDQPGTAWGLGKLPGCVVLTACRANEQAKENLCDGELHGVFTYRLLHAWRNGAKRYRDLYQRCVAYVHGSLPSQTPQIEGDLDRMVLGVERFATLPSVNVLEGTTGKVRLNAGAVHGVAMGHRFLVTAPGATVDGESGALVEVRSVGPTTALADRIDPTDATIEPGSQAVLVEVALPSKRRVQLLPQEGGQPPAVFTELEAALKGSRLLAPADGATPVTFQLYHTDAGLLEICEGGGAPLGQLKSIAADRPDATKLIMARLEHLARFLNVLQLANESRMSLLASSLKIEAFLAPSSYRVGDEKTVVLDQPIRPGEVIAHGSVLLIRLSHSSPTPVKLTVLNLDSQWGVSLVYPSTAAADLVDAGDRRIFPVQVEVPEGALEAREVLKLFATLDDTQFDWLCLPKLDGVPKALTRAVGTITEALFACLGKSPAQTRSNSDLAAASARAWACANLEILVAAEATSRPSGT